MSSLLREGETMNEKFYQIQIKGLILIMDQDGGSIARSYVVEKLNMILEGGIGFHPSILEKLDEI